VGYKLRIKLGKPRGIIYSQWGLIARPLAPWGGSFTDYAYPAYTKTDFTNQVGEKMLLGELGSPIEELSAKILDTWRRL
jgi:hypothetical protein